MVKNRTFNNTPLLHTSTRYTMQQIIEPVSIELLEAELNQQRFLRRTNKAGNELYIIDAHNSPNVMREIGRLREITFRTEGGGTGLAADIDEFDTMVPPYQQLVLWDPDAHQIIGGYRFIFGPYIKFDVEGQPQLSTSHLFHFSTEFIKDYLPNTIELGRSFIRPEYQSRAAGAKALYALDNLWDGLGALVVACKEIKYFFGKFTMYPTFDTECRDKILYFLDRHFADNKHLVTAKHPLQYKHYETLFPHEEMKDNYRILNAEVRKFGLNIPPLVNAYMNLSETMKVFGTSINDEFGDVEETGILITIKDIYDEKRLRHVDTFTEHLDEYYEITKFRYL